MEDRSKLTARHIGFGVKSRNNPKEILFYDPEGFAEAEFARAPFSEIKKALNGYVGSDPHTKDFLNEGGTIDDLMEEMEKGRGNSSKAARKEMRPSVNKEDEPSAHEVYNYTVESRNDSRFKKNPDKQLVIASPHALDTLKIEGGSMNKKNVNYRANILSSHEDRYITLLEKIMERKEKEVPREGFLNELKVQYVGFEGAMCLLEGKEREGRHRKALAFDLNLEDAIETKIKRHKYNLGLEEISRHLIEKKGLSPEARNLQNMNIGSVMALKEDRHFYGLTKAKMLAMDFNFRTNGGKFKKEYDFAGFTYDVLKSDGRYGNDDEVVIGARYVREGDTFEDFRVILVPGMQVPVVLKKDNVDKRTETRGIARIPGLKSTYEAVDKATGRLVRNTLLWSTDKTQSTQDFLESKRVLPRNYKNHWIKIGEEDGLLTSSGAKNYRKLSNGSTPGLTGKIRGDEGSKQLFDNYLTSNTPEKVRLPKIQFADSFIDSIRRHNYLVGDESDKLNIQFYPHKN